MDELRLQVATNNIVKDSCAYFHDVISKPQSTDPEAVHIIAGDFNHVVLPKFYQHVKCAVKCLGLPQLMGKNKLTNTPHLQYRYRQLFSR